MVSKLKRLPTEWEKVFANYTSDKGLRARIYRGLKKLNSPKINEPIKKWEAELNNIFSKKKYPNGQETHDKILTIPSHKWNGEDTGKKEFSYTAGRNVN
jgi:hypothetical protein